MAMEGIHQREECRATEREGERERERKKESEGEKAEQANERRGLVRVLLQ